MLHFYHLLETTKIIHKEVYNIKSWETTNACISGADYMQVNQKFDQNVTDLKKKCYVFINFLYNSGNYLRGWLKNYFLILLRILSKKTGSFVYVFHAFMKENTNSNTFLQKKTFSSYCYIFIYLFLWLVLNISIILAGFIYQNFGRYIILCISSPNQSLTCYNFIIFLVFIKIPIVIYPLQPG